jgi:hypothetical protein
LTLLACAALAACQASPKAESGTQSIGERPTLCVVSDWRQDAVASACKPEQPVAFLPNTFGNEQLPIMFSALNCDLEKQIVQTTGGVACTYRPVKVVSTEEKGKQPPTG